MAHEGRRDRAGVHDSIDVGCERRALTTARTHGRSRVHACPTSTHSRLARTDRAANACSRCPAKSAPSTSVASVSSNVRACGRPPRSRRASGLPIASSRECAFRAVELPGTREISARSR
ncbi:hypothetical protein PsYK624_074660 [Phanerochaete sordida]|uniref:Uncharacterized protein n=1 Tax=Phanerochaete sordida TaxID=48140 RepID=A0A9P3LET2_9APHY|nr:hypothetical protein PsYK624_074660 [Phanerochaete sordida]